MEKSTPRYWLVCVGEPVPLRSPETGRFKRLIVGCSDPAVTDDSIKEAVGDFVGFPAGLTMMFHEFERVHVETPNCPPTLARENAHIKFWLLADKPGNVP